MNLNLDYSVVSRFFGGIWSELRAKRLWPVAVLLMVAVIAVPVLLTKSPRQSALAQAPVPTPPPSSATTLPTLNVQSTPAHSRINGPERNPFGSAASSTGSVTAAASAAASTASSVASSAASTVTGGGGTSGASPVTSSFSPPSSTGSSNPPSITPNAHPKPAPTGLRPTQSYEVSLAMTVSQGGVDTIDSLERDSVIPADTNPRLVELGVLQGGKRVLFAVQPGTVISGPGTCTPGPIDCEILSLGQDQTESVAAQGPTGTGPTTLFAVTGISAVDHGSVAAADEARRASSAAGRTLLAASTSQTLSLFQYEPSLGSVVDLRNLTVGDS